MESDENYRTIFNAANDAIFVHDIETGDIIDVNQKMCEMYGYTPEKARCLNVEAISSGEPPYTQENALLLLRKAAKGEPQLFEWKCKDNAGRLFWVEVNVKHAVIRGKDRLLAIVHNITERKQLENEMARLDRLNLIGEMAAGIGHEIRNPITTVRGFLQMLGSKEECSKYKNYYNLMIEELDRANSILTEFLSLAKNKLQEKKSKNINAILKALQPLIQSDAIKNEINLILELGEIPDLQLDEKEIRQLILNLVRNGLDVILPGGNITIKTFMESEEIILSVQDEGKGIEPNVLEKLGTPFFTTKENGTGLGLAVCHSIATRHNARIEIETSSGGTTFSVRFKQAIKANMGVRPSQVFASSDIRQDGARISPVFTSRIPEAAIPSPGKKSQTRNKIVYRKSLNG